MTLTTDKNLDEVNLDVLTRAMVKLARTGTVPSN
jgi:hypothetical protein